MSTISIRAENGVERPSISYYKTSPLTISGSNQVISPASSIVTTRYGNMSNNVLNNGVNTRSLSAFVDANSPIHHLDIEGMSASATSCTDRILNSGAATWSSSAGSALAKGTYFGKECINLDACNQMSVSTSMGNLPQYYTMFVVWYPRVTNSGWRTFWRGSNDHQPMINNNATDLGIYSNRSGQFRDTGYNITLNQWQTMIVTGESISATSSTGTSTYYVNGTNVGTADRVKSGTNGDSFGWSGQAPGYFMEIGILGKVLNSTEIADLHTRLNGRIGGSAAGASWNDNISESYTYNNTAHPQDIRTYNRDRTTIVSSKPVRSTRILANSIRASVNVTGQVNTKLSDGSVVSGGGGGGGGVGSDSAVASTIKQIWY
jgi:hypothetical protein